MEVPVVKIKEGVAGSEAGEKLIKSIVNMVCLGWVPTGLHAEHHLVSFNWHHRAWWGGCSHH